MTDHLAIARLAAQELLRLEFPRSRKLTAAEHEAYLVQAHTIMKHLAELLGDYSQDVRE